MLVIAGFVHAKLLGDAGNKIQAAYEVLLLEFALYVYGGLGLGGALINIKYFIEANAAASWISEMIRKVVDIDSAKELGNSMSEVKGEVVESGSHEQLMQNLSGPFSIMVQLQRNFVDDEVTSKAQDTGSSSSVVLDTEIANAEQKDNIQPLHSFCMASLLAHYYFGIMGESLTKRFREALFERILKHEIEWFDHENNNNNSGSICSRLATDASMVKTLVADCLSMLAQAISSATLAVVLGNVQENPQAQNESSELASEAVVNHRIITAFCFQEKVLKLFELTTWCAGFGLFLSQFITGAIPALTYWYGRRILYHKEFTYKHLFQTFLILVTTGRLIAETGTITADLSHGKSALEQFSGF
ncbi:ATP-BINDING CASSETTE SUB-FAMILY B [Salix purpurea]|uniref:ATP-BINDING CASSETTE SUB-FAMILY B n=1 Tax=Salix purpurea TaxID=77065 RepID=A0A9Q0Q4C7_SALPP|nr:ATP-BINDING CASSETTE SUB-FAMILY B [Salix purpurea]